MAFRELEVDARDAIVKCTTSSPAGGRPDALEVRPRQGRSLSPIEDVRGDGRVVRPPARHRYGIRDYFRPMTIVRSITPPRVEA